MKWPSPVQSASHSAKIPANIVEDTSVAGRNLLAFSGASAYNTVQHSQWPEAEAGAGPAG